uniref:Uncharacterized protein LOC105107301 isoform X1 n=1 Tax=Rhizophora mucronata TaxID=61149 RepID=A0A2P2IX68_RHIMU
MWDCRLQSDAMSQRPHGVRGLSLSSNSKGSQRWVGSERHTNHQHSVSDGMLSYSDSPPHNIQQLQWTSPVQNVNLSDHAGSGVGGSRSQATWFPSSTERQFVDRSPSFGSPSLLSEFSNLESSSKQPFTFSSRNFSSRRPYMSKAVYPLVFRNPVSDCEAFGDAEISSFGGLTPGDDRISPTSWPDSRSSVDYKFHRTLTELQKLETSPEPGASSRRDGFRWSNASSYDMGLDGERFDLAEHLDVESLRSPGCPALEQKCGVCGKLLWQKSPWSSHRIMRGGDMPIAGVLACSHVFHAECLEQATPKTQICDPPCPLCTKTINPIEESPSFSEPLQMTLRSIHRNRGAAIIDAQGSHSNKEAPTHLKDGLRRKWHQPVLQQSSRSLSITNRLKRHFTFKGKSSKEIFHAKMFQKIGSSSSREPILRQMSLQ